jgi:hypothetical protein
MMPREQLERLEADMPLGILFSRFPRSARLRGMNKPLSYVIEAAADVDREVIVHPRSSLAIRRAALKSSIRFSGPSKG